jgi:hypothetical protein
LEHNEIWNFSVILLDSLMWLMFGDIWFKSLKSCPKKQKRKVLLV